MLKSIRPAQVIAATGVVLAVLIALLRPFGLSTSGAIVTALTTFTVTFWATNVLPSYFTGLIFLMLAILLDVAPADVVFSGFTSNAFWLVFGGVIIGAAIKHTGLAQRLAHTFANRLGGSYHLLIAGLVMLGVVLGFLIPSSMGRIVLFTPILLAVADRFGFEIGDNGHTGIVLAGMFGTYYPSFAILSANVPNLVLAGTAETVQGYTVLYAEYLLLHFPVMGALRAVLIAVLILLIFPATLKVGIEQQMTADDGMSRAEQRLLVFLLIALGFWLTDTLHGISAAWVAMSVGLVIITPMIGVLPHAKMQTDINYTLLFFVAAIISLGRIIAQSELSVLLSNFVRSSLPFAQAADFTNFLTLIGSSMAVSMIGTTPTVPALITPLVDDIALMTGVSIGALIMMQAIGMATIIFPYQAPPVIVGVQLGHLDMGRVLRFNLWLVLVTIVVLLPLDYLWWQWLGWL